MEHVIFFRSSLKEAVKMPYTYKLEQALENYSESSDKDHRLFAYEWHRQRTSRRFAIMSCDDMAATIESNRERYFYEVILWNKPCKLYFDLEYNPSINLHIYKDIIIRHFMKLVADTLQFDFSISCSPECMVVLDGSRKGKISFHVIVHFPEQNCFYRNCDIRRFCERMTRGYSAMSHDLPKQLREFVVKTESGKSQFVFDVNVYSKNQNFRLYQNCKMGMAVPFTYYPACRYYSLRKIDYNDKIILRDTLISILDDVDTSLFVIKNDPPQRPMIAQSSCSKNDPSQRPMIAQSSCSAKEQGVNIRKKTIGEGVGNQIDNIGQKKEANDNQRNQRQGKITDKGPYPKLYDFIDCYVKMLNGLANVYGMTADDQWLRFFISKPIYCEVKGSAHKSNHQWYVVDIEKMQFYQRCQDSMCKLMRYKLPERRNLDPILFDNSTNSTVIVAGGSSMIPEGFTAENTLDDYVTLDDAETFLYDGNEEVVDDVSNCDIVTTKFLTPMQSSVGTNTDDTLGIIIPFTPSKQKMDLIQDILADEYEERSEMINQKKMDLVSDGSERISGNVKRRLFSDNYPNDFGDESECRGTTENFDRKSLIQSRSGAVTSRKFSSEMPYEEQKLEEQGIGGMFFKTQKIVGTSQVIKRQKTDGHFVESRNIQSCMHERQKTSGYIVESRKIQSCMHQNVQLTSSAQRPQVIPMCGKVESDLGAQRPQVIPMRGKVESDSGAQRPQVIPMRGKVQSDSGGQRPKVIPMRGQVQSESGVQVSKVIKNPNSGSNEQKFVTMRCDSVPTPQAQTNRYNGGVQSKMNSFVTFYKTHDKFNRPVAVFADTLFSRGTSKRFVSDGSSQNVFKDESLKSDLQYLNNIGDTGSLFDESFGDEDELDEDLSSYNSQQKRNKMTLTSVSKNVETYNAFGSMIDNKQARQINGETTDSREDTVYSYDDNSFNGNDGDIESANVIDGDTESAEGDDHNEENYKLYA